MEAEVGLSVERARLLITDSQFTRAEVASYFGKPLNDIHTVPLASAQCFFPREKAQLENHLNRHGLSFQRYSLFVGTIEPRKNLFTLLDAYEQLSATLRRQWPLVLIGSEGWRSEAIHTRIARGVRAGWVRYLGFVDNNDLPLLYAGARLFVFPSLYEGFGLPVLEAMSSGVPVVCSNSSSLPEVAEGLALMCDPYDVKALSSLIERGLEDAAWRIEASSSGLAKARNYSWERCARATAEVYASALRN
jgi:alpha-1,3-rhamnosyl/mannosyltransferase